MATVTFTFDGGDPGHITGVTDEEYDRLFEVISALGGYDIEIERDSAPAPIPPTSGKRRKPE